MPRFSVFNTHVFVGGNRNVPLAGCRILQWAATILDEAIAWYLYQHVIDGYEFLMQNYNVGDRVCLFGSSGADGGRDGRQLTGCDFDTRILSWRIHCPSACGDVVQGIIRYHIYVFHLSLTPTRLAMQVGLLSKDNTEQYHSHTNSTSPVVQVMTPSPAGSRTHSVTLCPSNLLAYGGCL